jgi:hypothetical protein
MRFFPSIALLAVSAAGFASAQSCDSNKGACKYTTDCHAPAYYHVAGKYPTPRRWFN